MVKCSFWKAREGGFKMLLFLVPGNFLRMSQDVGKKAGHDCLGNKIDSCKANVNL